MARIILTVIFLVALAILIIMNIGASAAVNVFGWRIEELSVTVVALVSFVAGVLYSFIFYFMSYIERGRRERLVRRKQKLKLQETELKSREQEADELVDESRRQMENARSLQPPETRPGGAGFFSSLFGRRQPRESSGGAAGETTGGEAEPQTKAKKGKK